MTSSQVWNPSADCDWIRTHISNLSDGPIWQREPPALRQHNVRFRARRVHMRQDFFFHNPLQRT